MNRQILKTTMVQGVSLAAMLLSAVIPDRVEAQTRSIRIGDGVISQVEMGAGRTITIETDLPFADILVGNTNLVDVFPLTDTSLYIQARDFGTTNVTLYSETKKLLEVIDIRVLVDFSDLRAALRTAVPAADVEVTNVNNRIRLSGNVRDNVDLQKVLEIAAEYSEEPVINAIRVDSGQQVELDVRIIEVERRSGRELGVNLFGSNDSGSRQINTGLPPRETPFGIAVGNLLEISGIEIDFVINALESKGLARRLANPKLVTTSGVEANFVVGGEVPIRVSTESANGVVTTSTDFREFGVRLNFLPEVLDDELIRLRISPEVSDIDPTIDVNGEPGFISRKAETTVSLRNGQSFAIAGLLQTNNSRNIDQVPWIGQLPVIGALFRSAQFQKDESDLVILVTPRLVRPVAPGQPYASPFDDSRSSNDFELFVLGMLEVDKNLLRNFREGKGVVGPYGHIIDLEFKDAVIAKN